MNACKRLACLLVIALALVCAAGVFAADVVLYYTHDGVDHIIKMDCDNDVCVVQVRVDTPAGVIQSNDVAVDFRIAPSKFVGNGNTKVYHVLSCRYAAQLKNPVYFDSAEDAEGAGYRPCGHCKPDIPK